MHAIKPCFEHQSGQLRKKFDFAHFFKMLLALLVTGLIVSVAQAGDFGTKSVLTVPGLLRAPVVQAKVALSSSKPSYDVVQNQKQQTVVSQFEPNVVLHQNLPIGQHAYYGLPQYIPSSVSSAVSSPNPRYVQIVPAYFGNSFGQVQPQVIPVDAISGPVQFVFRSPSSGSLYRPVQVTPHVGQPQPALYLVQHVHDTVKHGQEIQPTVAKVEGSTAVNSVDVPTVQVLASSSSFTSQATPVKTSQVDEEKGQSVNDF